jgi:hypothetical protein
MDASPFTPVSTWNIGEEAFTCSARTTIGPRQRLYVHNSTYEQISKSW